MKRLESPVAILEQKSPILAPAGFSTSRRDMSRLDTGEFHVYTGKEKNENYFEEEKLLPYDPLPYAINQLEWQLPAEGRTKTNKNQTEDLCGKVRFKFRCGRTHEQLADERCYKASCPICHTHWRTRATRRATDRLTASIKFFGHYPKHISFSIYQHEKPFKEYKANFIRILKRIGGQSAMVLFHPFRFRDRQGEPVRYRVWANDRVNNHRIYSPHFHAMVFGQLSPYQKVHERYNIIYVNHGKRKCATRENPDQIGGTVDYLLSHSGVKTGYQTVGYMGQLKRVTVAYTKEKVPVMCKVKLPNGDKCNLPMARLDRDILGTGDWAVSDTIGTRVQRISKYDFRMISKTTGKKATRALMKEHRILGQPKRLVAESLNDLVRRMAN